MTYSKWLVTSSVPIHYMYQYRLIVSWALQKKCNEILLKIETFIKNAFKNVASRQGTYLTWQSYLAVIATCHCPARLLRNVI